MRETDPSLFFISKSSPENCGRLLMPRKRTFAKANSIKAMNTCPPSAASIVHSPHITLDFVPALLPSRATTVILAVVDSFSLMAPPCAYLTLLQEWRNMSRNPSAALRQALPPFRCAFGHEWALFPRPSTFSSSTSSEGRGGVGLSDNEASLSQPALSQSDNRWHLSISPRPSGQSHTLVVASV